MKKILLKITSFLVLALVLVLGQSLPVQAAKPEVSLDCPASLTVGEIGTCSLTAHYQGKDFSGADYGDITTSGGVSREGDLTPLSGFEFIVGTVLYKDDVPNNQVTFASFRIKANSAGKATVTITGIQANDDSKPDPISYDLNSLSKTIDIKAPVSNPTPSNPTPSNPTSSNPTPSNPTSPSPSNNTNGNTSTTNKGTETPTSTSEDKDKVPEDKLIDNPSISLRDSDTKPIVEKETRPTANLIIIILGILAVLIILGLTIFFLKKQKKQKEIPTIDSFAVSEPTYPGAENYQEESLVNPEMEISNTPIDNLEAGYNAPEEAVSQPAPVQEPVVTPQPETNTISTQDTGEAVLSQDETLANFQSEMMATLGDAQNLSQPQPVTETPVPEPVVQPQQVQYPTPPSQPQFQPQPHSQPVNPINQPVAPTPDNELPNNFSDTGVN